MLEVLKPSFTDNLSDVSFTSTVWFFSGQIQASPTVVAVGEIPLSRIDVERISAFRNPDPQSALGNPYFGVVYRSARSTLVTELGARIPIVSEDKPDALLQGLWSDIDRWEAFLPNMIALRLRVGSDVTSPSGASHILTRFRIGPTFWFPTESRDDGETFVDANAGIWYQPAKAMVGLSVSTRTLLSESDLSFTDRSEFQLGVDANMTFGNVRPGVHLHLPLSNEGLFATGEAVDFVFGLNVTVLFPRATDAPVDDLGLPPSWH